MSVLMCLQEDFSSALSPDIKSKNLKLKKAMFNIRIKYFHALMKRIMQEAPNLLNSKWYYFLLLKLSSLKIHFTAIRAKPWGPALWMDLVHAPHAPDAPLLIHLPAHGLRKSAKGGPSVWAPSTRVGILLELLAAASAWPTPGCRDHWEEWTSK